MNRYRRKGKGVPFSYCVEGVAELVTIVRLTEEDGLTGDQSE